MFPRRLEGENLGAAGGFAHEVIQTVFRRSDSVSAESKLTTPDFERLARMPWPIASLASSGKKLGHRNDCQCRKSYSDRKFQNEADFVAQ